jgi:hypothetical protein
MELQGRVQVIDPRLRTTLRAEHGAQGPDAWVDKIRCSVKSSSKRWLMQGTRGSGDAVASMDGMASRPNPNGHAVRPLFSLVWFICPCATLSH